MADQMEHPDEQTNQFTLPDVIKSPAEISAGLEIYRQQYTAKLEKYSSIKLKIMEEDYESSYQKTRQGIKAIRKIYEEYEADGAPLVEILEDFGYQRERSLLCFQEAERKYMSDWIETMAQEYDDEFEVMRGEVSEILERMENPYTSILEKFGAFINSQNLRIRANATQLNEFRSKVVAERIEKQREETEAFTKVAHAEMEKIHRRLAVEKPDRLIKQYEIESSRPGWNAPVERKKGVNDPFGQSLIATRALAMVRACQQRRAAAAKEIAKDPEKFLGEKLQASAKAIQEAFAEAVVKKVAKEVEMAEAEAEAKAKAEEAKYQ